MAVVASELLNLTFGKSCLKSSFMMVYGMGVVDSE